ncbi:MAG TPA: hypothetical protein VG605_09360 [Puia sp.]|nr:hypothetical protein [Puia sp.]
MEQNGKADISTTGLTAGAAPESLDMSVIGVVDQLLIGLTDKVLNVETATRDNIAQVRMMANSVELVRAIPGKMEAVEKQVSAWRGEIGGLRDENRALQGQVSGLRDKIAALERNVNDSTASAKVLTSSITLLHGELNHYSKEIAGFSGGKVYHKHQLDSFAIIVVMLVIIVGVLGASTYSMRRDVNQYKASDIKWRGAKLFAYGVMRSYLDTVEQRYNREPEDFGNGVTREEARLDSLEQSKQELQERQREVDQKKDEIEELQKRKTK